MTRLLVDTHAILWWLADDPALPEGPRALIAHPENEPLVSAAVLWEVAIKRSLGKVRAPANLPEVIAAEGFTLLAVAPAHAWAVHALPLHHRDPFDRLLVAQAVVEAVPLVSADPELRRYGIDVRW